MKLLFALMAIFALIFVVRADKTVCSLPKDIGPCRAEIPRVYFNGKACESFLYGGCKGNGNQFSTKAECEKVCL